MSNLFIYRPRCSRIAVFPRSVFGGSFRPRAQAILTSDDPKQNAGGLFSSTLPPPLARKLPFAFYSGSPYAHLLAWILWDF